MGNTDCYKNRELSWLQFNERVLNEAGNPRIPLAERLSFISIYQSNLDEFFMVRVGTLMVQMNSKEEIRENKTWMTSREQVNAILERVKTLETKKTVIYDDLMANLKNEGLSIINFNKLQEDDAILLEKYFDTHIAPFLSPIIVNKHQTFPFLDNKELYAIAILEKDDGKKKIGIVPCANTVFKRLIGVPSRPGTFMLSEELILHFVTKLFDRYNVVQKAVMRVTRNADINAGDVYDEDLDYRDVMEQLIKQRKRLSPVRLELSRDIDKKTQEKIASFLGIDTNHIIRVNTPLEFSFARLLQNYLADRTTLFYKQRSPQLPSGINVKESIIKQIEQKDILLSYPFESMKPFMRLLRDAADDETVISIKITLYRVADRSKVIELLTEAAENGKEVTVLVELRARFDEANNIEMSRRLEEAGCILPVRVEGIRFPLYLLSESLPLLEAVLAGGADLKPRLEFLAPLDPMMWDRKLIEALWGYQYSWEIYTPQVKRKYGYYVLPMLCGDRFIGRIEPKADRKAGILTVSNIWLEPGVRQTKKLSGMIDSAVQRLAKFNGCSVPD